MGRSDSEKETIAWIDGSKRKAERSFQLDRYIRYIIIFIDRDIDIDADREID